LGQGFERRNGVSVFAAREVTTQQSCTPIDIALRETPLAAITLDHFSDIHSRLFFWHGLPTRGGSLLTNSRSGKRDFQARGSNPITAEGNHKDATEETSRNEKGEPKLAFL